MPRGTSANALKTQLWIYAHRDAASEVPAPEVHLGWSFSNLTALIWPAAKPYLSRSVPVAQPPLSGALPALTACMTAGLGLASLK